MNQRQKQFSHALHRQRGSLIAKNTLINVVGQLAPAALALLTIPYILRGLNPDRFGLLSLAWILSSSIPVFDMGLGRATVHSIAKAEGANRSGSVPKCIWTSLLLNVSLGALVGMILLAITPWLVEEILVMSPELKAETARVLKAVAVFAPGIMAVHVLKGVLMANQRFASVNIVQVCLSASTLLLPVAGVFFTIELPVIIVMIMASRLLAAVVFLLLCCRIYPNLLRAFGFSMEFAKPLFSFGGWVMMSSLTSATGINVERMIILALRSPTALAFYSAPAEMVARLAVLPTSISVTLFPALSFHSKDNLDKSRGLFLTSIRVLCFVMLPATMVFLLFSDEFLSVWLGVDYVARSATVLRIMVMAALINAFAHVPYVAVQGMNRPDLKAKLDLILTFIAIFLLCTLVGPLGIRGAAWTRLLVCGLDLAFLLYFTCNVLELLTFNHLISELRAALLLLIAYVTACLLSFAFFRGAAAKGVFFGVATTLYTFIFWVKAFSKSEKAFVVAAARKALTTVRLLTPPQEL